MASKWNADTQGDLKHNKVNQESIVPYTTKPLRLKDALRLRMVSKRDHGVTSDIRKAGLFLSALDGLDGRVW